MKYLKFKSPWEHNENSKTRGIIEKIIAYIGLSSNPDYEKDINSVAHWLVEFDEDNIPIREIGLDNSARVILKMPYKKNYGYWTDNSLGYEDFIDDFGAVKIEKNEFEEKWKGYIAS